MTSINSIISSVSSDLSGIKSGAVLVRASALLAKRLDDIDLNKSQILVDLHTWSYLVGVNGNFTGFEEALTGTRKIRFQDARNMVVQYLNDEKFGTFKNHIGSYIFPWKILDTIAEVIAGTNPALAIDTHEDLANTFVAIHAVLRTATVDDDGFTFDHLVDHFRFAVFGAPANAFLKFLLLTPLKHDDQERVTVDPQAIAAVFETYYRTGNIKSPLFEEFHLEQIGLKDDKRIQPKLLGPKGRR